MDFNNSLISFEIYNPGSSLSGFQVKINLSKIEEDAGATISSKDIRIFSKYGETKFCYEQKNGECNESKSNAIWLKSSLSHGSNLFKILISYGDGSTDGNAVFDFYDDFSSPTLNTTKWDTFAGNGHYELQNKKIKF